MKFSLATVSTVLVLCGAAINDVAGESALRGATEDIDMSIVYDSDNTMGGLVPVPVGEATLDAEAFDVEEINLDNEVSDGIDEEGNRRHLAQTVAGGGWRAVYPTGTFKEITVGGPKNTIVAIGTNNVPYRMNANRNSFSALPGKGLGISVGEDSMHILGTNSVVYEWKNNNWTPVTITINAKKIEQYADHLCVIGTNGRLYCKYTFQNTHRDFGGTNLRSLAVCPDETKVVVTNPNGATYTNSGSAGYKGPWPGSFIDVGCGGDGIVYTIGTGRQVYRWQNGHRDELAPVPGGGGNKIAVGWNGIPWVITPQGKIYEYVPPRGTKFYNY